MDSFIWNYQEFSRTCSSSHSLSCLIEIQQLTEDDCSMWPCCISGTASGIVMKSAIANVPLRKAATTARMSWLEGRGSNTVIVSRDFSSIDDSG